MMFCTNIVVLVITTLVAAQLIPSRRLPYTTSILHQNVPLKTNLPKGTSPVVDFAQFSQGPLALLLMRHYLSRNVTVEQVFYQGRLALKVSSSNNYASFQHALDQLRHTYVQLPLTTFYEGIIEVDIATVRNGRSNGLMPTSAGLAFRMQSYDHYDLVQLRSITNEWINVVRPVAIDRAAHTVQYVSSPLWTSQRLSREHPGQYEASVRIRNTRWSRLRIEIRNNTISAFVGLEPVITSRLLLGSRERGAIAYWVDEGTDAYFSGLVIREGLL